jgi:hypothetical protein
MAIGSTAASPQYVCYVEQRPARQSASSRRAIVAAGLIAVAVCAAVSLSSFMMMHLPIPSSVEATCCGAAKTLLLVSAQILTPVPGRVAGPPRFYAP